MAILVVKKLLYLFLKIPTFHVFCFLLQNSPYCGHIDLLHYVFQQRQRLDKLCQRRITSPISAKAKIRQGPNMLPNLEYSKNRPCLQLCQRRILSPISAKA